MAESLISYQVGALIVIRVTDPITRRTNKPKYQQSTTVNLGEGESESSRQATGSRRHSPVKSPFTLISARLVDDYDLTKSSGTICIFIR